MTDLELDQFDQQQDEVKECAQELGYTTGDLLREGYDPEVVFEAHYLSAYQLLRSAIKVGLPLETALKTAEHHQEVLTTLIKGGQ